MRRTSLGAPGPFLRASVSWVVLGLLLGRSGGAYPIGILQSTLHAQSCPSASSTSGRILQSTSSCSWNSLESKAIRDHFTQVVQIGGTFPSAAYRQSLTTRFTGRTPWSSTNIDRPLDSPVSPKVGQNRLSESRVLGVARHGGLRGLGSSLPWYSELYLQQDFRLWSALIVNRTRPQVYASGRFSISFTVPASRTGRPPYSAAQYPSLGSSVSSLPFCPLPGFLASSNRSPNWYSRWSNTHGSVSPLGTLLQNSLALSSI